VAPARRQAQAVFEQELLKDDFEKIRPGSGVKQITIPAAKRLTSVAAGETEEKEKAIRSRFVSERSKKGTGGA